MLSAQRLCLEASALLSFTVGKSETVNASKTLSFYRKMAQQSGVQNYPPQRG
jgi:hypothetical protein